MFLLTESNNNIQTPSTSLINNPKIGVPICLWCMCAHIDSLQVHGTTLSPAPNGYIERGYYSVGIIARRFSTVLRGVSERLKAR